MRFFSLLTLLAATSWAHGAVNITAYESLDDVVFTLSGSVDTAGLSLVDTYSLHGNLTPSFASFINSPGTDLTPMLVFVGITSAPMDFGSGASTTFDTSEGSLFGIDATSIFLPVGYVSGASLSSTFKIENATFESLGMDAGVYTYNWGSGVNADLATLTIGGTPAVPEPTTYALLGGVAAFGFAAWRRRRA
ncbi:MAG: PEP-CTERM sorting domain-containing protein [Verrucomicrobiota bacterium JB022]|nr:PEP-CTERM sorting domain-containing protein [Verrucomicrobiota bacterium JB022]